MKDFFINRIIWFYDHPIITAVLLSAVLVVLHWLIYGKYLDMPASEVPAWVLM